MYISRDGAMIIPRESVVGKIRKGAKFDFTVNLLTYHDDVKGAPQNSIIGGATLWVMSGKKPQEYKGVAKFFSYLSRSDIQMDWHISTGYVPITKAAFEMTEKTGYSSKQPWEDVAIRQLNSKAPTGSSKGRRFGKF